MKKSSSIAVREPASAEAEAYAYLLNRIRNGALKPGARLRAEKIATEIGMSRMPVREAFRRLDTEGYVTIRPNRGAVVTDHTFEEVQELSRIFHDAARQAVPVFPAEGTADTADVKPLFEIDREDVARRCYPLARSLVM